MSCSVHPQFPAGKPVPVSVNGVAIPRDAIVREMQHHPAAKPIAAWQQAARALVVRELLLQRAQQARPRAREPISDADGRRETDEEALIRGVVEREVTVPEPDDATCRRYYAQNRGALPRRRTSTRPRISCSRRLPSDREAYAQARADADGRSCDAAGKSRSPSPLWRRPIRAARRRRRAAISANSPRARPRRNSSARCWRSRPANSAPSRSRRATASTSSGSSASTKAGNCPMRPWPSASPTTCAKACGGAPMRNTSRGWCRRLQITGLALEGAEAHRVN